MSTNAVRVFFGSKYDGGNNARSMVQDFKMKNSQQGIEMDLCLMAGRNVVACLTALSVNIQNNSEDLNVMK